MQAADQIVPVLLLVIASVLAFISVRIIKRLQPRRRLGPFLVCMLCAIGLVSIAASLEIGLLRDARKSAVIFASIDSEPELTAREVQAFQELAASSSRVRVGVMRLAFGNSTNAAIALPRLEILLHCAIRSGTRDNEPERLWTKVVEPALRKRSSREIVFLAAATAGIGQYGPARAKRVLQQLAPWLRGETNPIVSATAAGIFMPLVESATPEQVESAANLQLQLLLEEANPMQVNTLAGTVKREGTRCFGQLRLLAGGLSEPAARRLADRVLPELSQTNQSRVLPLGLVLETMKSRLAPEQVERAVTNLIRQLPRSRGGVLPERASPLAGMAEVMSPEQAARAVPLLLDCVRQESDPWWHAELARPLKLMAPRLSDSELEQLAEEMAAASPEVVEAIRDRIPQEHAYVWMDRLLQGIIDTPNPTRRSAQVPRAAPLAGRLTSERAGKLVGELWQLYLRDPDGLRQWDEACCLAALAPRLTAEQAVQQGTLIVERMKEPHTDLAALIKMLTPLLDHCSPSLIEGAVGCVMRRQEQEKSAFRLGRVQQREFLLGAHFTAEQRRILLEPLVAALEASVEPGRYMVWTWNLAPLTDLMAADQAERVGSHLVQLYTQPSNPAGLLALNSLATNVTVTPEQSRRIVDVLLPKALECRMPDSDIYARCSGWFLRRLDSAQAETNGQKIIAAMARMREPMWALLDAKCLVPLAEGLPPAQARRLAERLLEVPSQRGNQPGFGGLMDPARGAESSADWMVPSVFIQMQEDRAQPYRLQAWSRSMAALLARMEKADAETIADKLAARCAEQGKVGPMSFDDQLAFTLRYASEPALTGILQTPFAVGGLRRAVLRARELKAGQMRD